MEISYRQEVYRKLIHFSSLWMPLLIYMTPKMFSSAVFLILLLGNVMIEYATYRHWPYVTALYNRFFGKMMREKERIQGKFRISGSPYVLAGAFLSAFLFHREIAVIAMTSMLLADPAAALVGRRFGRIHFKNGKSYEGTAAFFLTAYIVHLFFGIVFHLPGGFFAVALISCTAAAMVELYEKTLKIDDNLSIPICIGLILSLYFI